MEENKENWLERSEAERKRKLEDEKQERLYNAGHKRSRLEKKIQEKADKKPKKKKNKGNCFKKAGREEKTGRKAEDEVWIVETKKRKIWKNTGSLERTQEGRQKDGELQP